MGNEGDLSSTAFSVEAPIVLRGGRLGLSLGPALCLPLSGGGEIAGDETTSEDSSEVEISMSSFALVISGYVFL